MELPVEAALPALREALREHRSALLVAPPGAGKTTRVPPALLGEDWIRGGRIVMLEPRRLAARAAATRMAGERGETPGGLIGFRTRIDSATGPGMRIEVLTEGLLVRRLLTDPGLEGVSLVILDEVHERSIEADLAIALCREVQSLRPELRLLAMSATPDMQRLAPLLAGPVVAAEGRTFPTDIRHAKRDLAHPRDLPSAAARAVREALADSPGDILVFLPGMAEIRRTEEAIGACDADVLALHGDLPPATQLAALSPGERRRVVLATSIAETSLTIPGVRMVVDGGFRRAPVFDPGSGLTRLTTARISRAAATQRAGRAGREGPGIVIRLWTTALHRGLPASERPEILAADLAPLCLTCAAWGATPESLPFPDAPPPAALATATALLRDLGALDEANRITDTGRRMAALGAHPRLAAMMLAARSPAEAALAADLAALMEERDPLREAASADIALRLDALAHDRRLGTLRRTAATYRRRLDTSAPAEGEPGRLIAAAFPDRIAQRREPGSFRLAGGGGASLPLTDPLAQAPFLAIAAVQVSRGTTIRLAAPLDPADLPEPVAAKVTVTQETAFDPTQEAVIARRRRRLGALILEDRTIAVDPEVTARALAEAVSLPSLPWTDAVRQLQARIGLAARLFPHEDWPDLSDHALAADRTWLAQALYGRTRLADAGKLDLLTVLSDLLGRSRRHRLETMLPAEIALPGGRARVDYTQPEPLAAARAQAFYGLADTPRLAEGRLVPRLALLSPAGRPIAVTADLAGFWRGAWREVRAQMRGRYPRHAWPENPLAG
ncbi:MAG: ATP-dependent helicase HrpB [Rhodospirillales bacterium]|nr:ATP-dependent helicase HrpB [Rhodospirillales bacterium]